MCDQCRATSYLSHPITGCTLTRLTGAGQSPFCSLAVTVSDVPRERWLEVFWILLIRSRYRSAHWDLWNRTIAHAHYNDVIMNEIASQITSLTIVYSIVYSDADQRKHQSSASLAFVWGIHREPVNSPHKWPVTRKMFPFDDVIMLRPDFCHFADIFKCTFLNENVWISLKISPKFIPRQGSNWQHSSIGSDNGFVPTRRQAVIWTNDG